ncbi:MAG: malectin domain-containing carbohydrate-binding protein [Pseudomonadota bacterium]
MEITPGVDGVYQAEDATLDGVGIQDKSFHLGYEGTGYVDYDGSTPTGESITWHIDFPSSGEFTLTWRYGLKKGDRPLDVEVNGQVVEASKSFAATGDWTVWGTVSTVVTLDAGVNSISLTAIGSSGANIDSLTVTENSPPPVDLFEAQVNFQASGAAVPSGYVADLGEAYDEDRGYGWVTEASAGGTSAIPLDVTQYARARDLPGTDSRLSTLVHLQKEAAAWEYEVENGFYAVTVSVGDSFTDSAHVLNVEGQALLPSFAPSGPHLYEVATTVVEVTDGKITIDAIGGDNTKINYVHIAEVSGDPAPEVASSTPASRATGVDPEASVTFEVSLLPQNGTIDETSLSSSTVKLYETNSGTEVPGLANTTGGGDSITFTPSVALQPNTHYSVVIDGVTDLAGRPFDPYTTTFTTGEGSGGSTGDELNFSVEVQDQGDLYTSVTVSPDGEYLYAATITGELIRWTIDPDTGALSNKEVNDAYGSNTIIGLEFRPGDSSELWITVNGPAFANNHPDFTGEIVKVSINEGEDFTTSAGITQEVYVTGLPRSAGDHLANSLEFGPDGQLYLTMGSQSAMGEADPNWGFRDERLLSGAVLKIDPDRTPPQGGFDVQTDVEDYDPNQEGLQSTPISERVLSADGEGYYVPGFYNPFEEDAVVQIYGEGVRNAYDLVWHSSGNLYVPTNGSAGGGYVPEDPTQPGTQAIPGDDPNVNGAPVQNDYLFNVVEGGYYGHPNELLGNYILNGGNPTAGVDPAEVVTTNPNSALRGYEVGVNPDPEWQGFAYDFGAKISPNGVVEYQNGALSGALLVAEYSQSDSIRVLRVDPVTGEITDGSETLRDENGDLLRFDNPLDVATDPRNGNIYVASLDPSGQKPPAITLLRPTVSQPPADGPAVSLGADLSEVESAGSLAIPVTLDSAAANTDGVTVTLRIIDGAAQAGTDFSVPGATVDGQDLLATVTIPAGQTSGSLPITLIDIAGDQGSRGFTVEIDAVSGSNATIVTASDDLSVTITDDDAGGPGGEETVIYRVNAGGNAVAAIDGGIDWESSKNANPSIYSVGETKIGVRNDAVDLSLVDASTAPEALFLVGQIDPNSTPQTMQWAFPVEAGGEYRVTLYFAEKQTNLSANNQRYFDVSVNGQVPAAFDDINPWALAGQQSAVAVSVTTTVTMGAGDTLLDLETLSQDGTPYIHAIEIAEIGDGPPPAPAGEITIENPEQILVNQTRLVFNKLEDKTLPNKVFEDNTEASFVIRNDGTDPLEIQDLDITGPFEFIDPSQDQPTTLAAGESVEIGVRFVGTPVTGAEIQTGTVTITSNDADEGVSTVDLAGYYQEQPESGIELSALDHAELFGFTTDFGAPGELENSGNAFEAIGDEVLSTTWVQADSGAPIEVTQLGAWTRPLVYTFKTYDPTTLSETAILSADKEESNTVLPTLSNSDDLAQASFNEADPFGIIVAGGGNKDFSDPQYNTDQGHLVRFFTAKDEDGQVIDNTYVVLHDYIGANDDYNDNVYVISNIDPYFGFA